MIVCLCRVVSDRTVRAVITGGADSLEAVARACSAGTGCGACRPMIADMLAAAGCAHEGRCADCPRHATAPDLVASRAA